MGTIFSVLLLHSLVAVGFKNYYFDASLPSHFDIDSFHSLHSQVQNIEHSHARLEISSMVNNLNEAEVQRAKMKKSEEITNTEKKKNDVVVENAKLANVTMISKVAAKITRPV